MVVKCDTLAEAEELQSSCAICGLEKFNIQGHFKAEGQHWTVGRCEASDCTVHCHGHGDRKVVVDLGDGYREAPGNVVGFG